MGFWVLGLRVWGLGFGILGLEFRVWGLGFGIWGLGVRVQGPGSDFRESVDPSLGFRVEGLDQARGRAQARPAREGAAGRAPASVQG